MVVVWLRSLSLIEIAIERTLYNSWDFLPRAFRSDRGEILHRLQAEISADKGSLAHIMKIPRFSLYLGKEARVVKGLQNRPNRSSSDEKYSLSLGTK